MSIGVFGVAHWWCSVVASPSLETLEYTPLSGFVNLRAEFI